MRWFLSNHHPIADALAEAGEDVISTPGHHQVAHYDWIADLIEQLPADPVAFSPSSGLDGDPFSAVLNAATMQEFDEHDRDPADYPLGRYLSQMDPDVFVVTPLFQKGMGCAKGAVMRWANRRHRVIVGMASDPGTIDMARRNRWRGCSINIHNLHVYVTNDVPSANISARDRRTVYWVPGMGAETLVEVVKHARSGRTYVAGRMGKPFGVPS